MFNKQTLIILVAVVVLYFMFTTKRSSLQKRRNPQAAAAMRELEDRTREVRRVWRSNDPADRARLAEIMDLIKNGDKLWKQAWMDRA